MTEITDLSTTDSLNTVISTYSLDGNIANMSTADNVFQSILGMLARSLKSSIWRMRDGTDATKLLAFDLSGLTTATTRTLTAPNASGTIALTTDLPAADRGQLFGLTLSNNVADATNDIDIAAGQAANDATTPSMMTLASALTKRLDAAWAVGTGNGGLDTGSIANAWYHVHLIKRVDTGVVDALFSLSPTAPTMPANYTLRRYIGSVLRVAGALKPFSQLGDQFLWTTPGADVNVTNLGATETFYTVSTPLGVQVDALMRVLTTNAAINAVKISSPNETDSFDSLSGDVTLINPVAAINNVVPVQTRTDTSSRIRARAALANTTLRIATYGYINTRGRT